MKHAREDYNRIQDPEGLIPENEPVFLLRGRDVCAPAALEAWSKEAAKYGVDQEMIDKVDIWAQYMRKWQAEHESKVPDMPMEDKEL